MTEWAGQSAPRCGYSAALAAVSSPELAQALGVVVGWRGRQVKVILLTQDTITPRPGSEWLGEAVEVFVGGLDSADFRILLESLDPVGKHALAALDHDTLRILLKGNPGLAELFCAALGLSQGQLLPAELTEQLARESPQYRDQRLARPVVQRLSPEQRRVVVAIDAFGMPVTSEQVSELLDRPPPTGQVAELLDGLASWHVIAGRRTAATCPRSR